MIVIYTQDNTFIRKNADEAKELLFSLYGEKMGKEAYDSVLNGRIGTIYRKNGGPLVQIVDAEKAEWIRDKEKSIGMMV